MTSIHKLISSRLLDPLSLIIIQYADYRTIVFDKEIECKKIKTSYITDTELCYIERNEVCVYDYINNKKKDSHRIGNKNLSTYYVIYCDSEWIIIEKKNRYCNKIHIAINRITCLASDHDVFGDFSIFNYNKNIMAVGCVYSDNIRINYLGDNYSKYNHFYLSEKYDDNIEYHFIFGIYENMIYVIYYKIINNNVRCDRVQIVKYSITDKKLISTNTLMLKNNMYVCNNFKWHTWYNDKLYLMCYKKGGVMIKEKFIYDNNKYIAKIDVGKLEVINYYGVHESINKLSLAIKFNSSSKFMFSNSKNIVAMKFDFS